MKTSALLSVGLPLILFAAWVGKVSVDAKMGQEVTLAIRGFDPRDLLAGHYLRYQVEWGTDVCANAMNQGRETCLCLSDETPAKVDRHAPCQYIGNSCPRMLKGKCTGGRFDAGLERYYFPEAWRGKLITVPNDATILVSLTNSGAAIVKALHVGGRPLSEWVEKN